jgi:hypothetical protein
VIILNLLITALIINFLLANFTFGSNKKIFVHYLFLILGFIYLVKKIVKIEMYLSEDIRRKYYMSLTKQVALIILYLLTVGASIYLFYFLKRKYPFILEYLVF